MKRFWMSSATAIIFICIGAGTARAGGVVFDPINYIENYATAISNVEQYAQQIDQYVTQLQQLRYQVQSLKNLDPNAVGGILQTAHLNKQLDEYQQLQGALYKTYGSLNDVQNTLHDSNNLLSGQGLNPLTQNIPWSKYQQARVQLGKKQGQSATESMTSTYKSIKSADSNIASLKRIEGQIKENAGNQSMKASMQTMNGSLNLIAHQNQQMLQAMLPLTMMKEEKLREQALRQQNIAGPQFKREQAKQKAFYHNTNVSGGYLACAGAGHFTYTPSQIKILAKEGINVRQCPSAPVTANKPKGGKSGGGR